VGRLGPGGNRGRWPQGITPKGLIRLIGGEGAVMKACQTDRVTRGVQKGLNNRQNRNLGSCGGNPCFNKGSSGRAIRGELGKFPVKLGSR